MKQVDAFIITSTRAPGKTRKAWYQYILVCNGHTVQKKEQVLDTTGHRMVLECAIAALKRMNQSAMITIHTDNGWKRSDGKELRNLDLWQEIEELLRPHAVQFHIENMELYKNPNERRPC